MKIINKPLLLLGLLAGFSSAVSAQSLSVGSASGAPGGGTTPAQVPVTFTRNAAAPVADFGVRVNFTAANLSATVAAANGGGCSVNNAMGFVTVLAPPGQTDVATNIYCNITFTIAPAAPAPSSQPLTLSFPPGLGCIDSDANTVNCTLVNGAIDVTGGGMNTPPNIAYNPLTGTTINYTGGGTASPIVATPSGGAGAGAAATTTVGACTITGGGAAFPVTNIPQLSFVGATVTPQNINLPNCVPQAGGATNATLTCPETQGAGAAVNRVWTLSCPQGVANTPPTLIYQPAPGNVTISGAVGSTQIQTLDISCNGVAGGSGNCLGSGSGAGATARVANVTVTGFSPSSLSCAFANEAGNPVASPLDFIAGQADPGDIRCSCVIPAINQNYIVTATETPNLSAPGTTVQRQWNVTCGAGGVCGSLTANPASGAALNFTAPTGTTQTVAFTPAGGNVIAQTLSCTLGGANPGAFAFNSPAAFPISFPAGSTTVQNVVLGCTNNTLNPQTATMTCTRTCDTATTTFNYTLTCPPQAAPPVADAVPVPALSESGRILLAALALLLGLAVVGFRMRG